MKENFFVMHFSCYLFKQKMQIFQISWDIALSFQKRPDGIYIMFTCSLNCIYHVVYILIVIFSARLDLIYPNVG